jgi:hypothetical protein
MIARYGFYEGPGVHYRVDPETVIRFFNLHGSDRSNR